MNATAMTQGLAHRLSTAPAPVATKPEPILIPAGDGIQFRKIDDRKWKVTIDGKEMLEITQRGPAQFIAWIGCQDSHWCFANALKACADHARFHRGLQEDAARKKASAVAALAAMSPEQRESQAEWLEIERDNLDYADSHMDVVGRKAALDRRIAVLRGA